MIRAAQSHQLAVQKKAGQQRQHRQGVKTRNYHNCPFREVKRARRKSAPSSMPIRPLPSCISAECLKNVIPPSLKNTNAISPWRDAGPTCDATSTRHAGEQALPRCGWFLHQIGHLCGIEDTLRRSQSRPICQRLNRAPIQMPSSWPWWVMKVRPRATADTHVRKEALARAAKSLPEI